MRIAPPPRAGTVLILAITSLVALAPVSPGGGALVAGAAIALLTAVSAWQRSREAVHLGLFWTLVGAAHLTGVVYSQVIFGIAIVAYAAVTRAVPWLRGSVGWAQRGTFDRGVGLLVVAAVATSSAALVLWYQLTKPDLIDVLRNFVPDVALWILLSGAVGFSMLNAFVEEIAYRGVLMQATDAALGVGVASLVVQAAAFGLLHINGVPRGWIGVVLATIYGLMMGLIRRRARGMLAPWLAHVFTDVTIAGIVLAVAR